MLPVSGVSDLLPSLNELHMCLMSVLVLPGRLLAMCLSIDWIDDPIPNYPEWCCFEAHIAFACYMHRTHVMSGWPIR